MVIQAQDKVSFEESRAISIVGYGSNGQGGNVLITTDNLGILGAYIGAGTAGRGNAGNVVLDIKEKIWIDGVDGLGWVVNSVFSDAEGGDGGDILITAKTLDILNGAQITTGIFGMGNAGNVILDIQENIRMDGVNPNDYLGGLGTGISGGINSGIASDGQGQGGDIQITAGNLEIFNGSQINAGTNGIGDAGNIFLDIQENIRLDGVTPTISVLGGSDYWLGGINNSVGLEGKGQGGDVRIAAGNLDILNGSQINAGTNGIGDAGNIFLDIQENIRLDGVTPQENFEGILVNFPGGINSSIGYRAHLGSLCRGCKPFNH